MWNDRYSGDVYVCGTMPNDFLYRVSNFVKGNKVLCLGEGEGRNAVYLAREGFDVSAVDSSPLALENAERLADQSYVDINTQVAELSQYVIKPKRWSGIVSIFCHLPSAVRTSLHKKIVVGLKPGGIFIMEAYRSELLASLSQLKQELAGLEFLHIKEVVRDVNEGSFKKKNAELVQLVARKPF
ncbi:class I SAM-dependent methyltransferase [Leucothrix arctica]|uniref:SAM-dependent methyltransferase n=1 Tax=Leucothrix arctica TaxID=1481894 RepID=A0A317CK45_9GAMM|nr:class I SAM-dependent methyltransferase [Leucothrix arctica]PWQ98551.1 SAM-dependent methyltransferase [Leucothrix arctica]